MKKVLFTFFVLNAGCVIMNLIVGNYGYAAFNACSGLVCLIGSRVNP